MVESHQCSNDGASSQDEGKEGKAAETEGGARKPQLSEIKEDSGSW
jgi:hypothetical protein